MWSVPYIVVWLRFPCVGDSLLCQLKYGGKIMYALRWFRIGVGSHLYTCVSRFRKNYPPSRLRFENNLFFSKSEKKAALR